MCFEFFLEYFFGLNIGLKPLLEAAFNIKSFSLDTKKSSISGTFFAAKHG